jgi:hypothetical protein
VILDVSDEFMKKITNMKELTLFAPSNEAWADSSVINNVLSNREKMLEILNLHLVPRRLPIDKILEDGVHEVSFELFACLNCTMMFEQLVSRCNSRRTFSTCS